MIKYKKYKNTNEKSPCFGKWYGRAVHELMEFDEFVEHMAKHHCVYSEGTIRGVLIEMEVCLREMLLEGKAVRFDDLGIFRLGLETIGEEKSSDFNTDDIKGIRMNLYLGKRFRAANLFKDAKFKEADKYIGDGNYYETDPDGGEDATVDGNQQGQGASQGGSSSNTGGGTNGGNSAGGSNSGGGEVIPGSGGSDHNGSANGEPGNYRLVIYKYGNGTATVTDDSENVLHTNDYLASGSNVNVSVVPVAGKMPLVTYNGSNRVTMTENDGVYVGSFQMPTKGTALEINTDPDDDDWADQN